MKKPYQNGKAVIWTQSNCQYCGMAKALLTSRGYEVEEREIGVGKPWTKKDLIDVVPTARSVPQIFIDEVYIGGYGQLKELLYNDIPENT